MLVFSPLGLGLCGYPKAHVSKSCCSWQRSSVSDLFEFIQAVPTTCPRDHLDFASDGSPREAGKEARVSTVEHGAWIL